MDINSFFYSLEIYVNNLFISSFLFRYVCKKKSCQIERFDISIEILVLNTNISSRLFIRIRTSSILKQMAGHKIKLQSSDGDTFDVEVEIAKQSATIKTMLEGN